MTHVVAFARADYLEAGAREQILASGGLVVMPAAVSLCCSVGHGGWFACSVRNLNIAVRPGKLRAEEGPTPAWMDQMTGACLHLFRDSLNVAIVKSFPRAVRGGPQGHVHLNLEFRVGLVLRPDTQTALDDGSCTLPMVCVLRNDDNATHTPGPK